MGPMFIKIEDLTSDEINKLQLAAVKFADGDINKLFTIFAKNYLLGNMALVKGG